MISEYALSRFFDRLRARGFTIGVDQYLEAFALLRHWQAAAAPDGPSQPLEMRSRLAPIVCTTEAEQAQFYRLFQDWLREHDLIPDEALELDEETTLAQQAVTLRRRRLWLVAFGFVLGLALLSGQAVLLHHEPEELIQPQAKEAGAQVDRSTTPESSPEPTADLTVTTDITPPSETDEFARRLDEIWSAFAALVGQGAETAPLAAVPLILCILWLLTRAARVGIVLSQAEARGSPAIERLRIPGLLTPLLGTSLSRDGIKGLHGYRRSAAETLDVEATVSASIEALGLFRPVQGTVPQLHDYLILVEWRGEGDHFARFADGLITEMRDQQIPLTALRFRRDPRRCHLPGQPDKVFHLEDLHARYGGARLMIFSDARSLLPPRGVAPLPWTERLLDWPEVTLLTPATPADWGAGEWALRQRGLRVFPADQLGMQGLVASLAEAEDKLESHAPRALADARPLPSLLRERPDYWLASRPPPVAEIETLKRQLRGYLGVDGYRWLCACAVYPMLHWDLTLHLGSRLLAWGRDALAQERRLLDLCRLPWFRQGAMPDWLRVALISDLARRDRKVVRETLYRLLAAAMRKSGTDPWFEISVQRLETPLDGVEKVVVQELVESETAGSPLVDYALLRFLKGGTPTPADLSLPSWILRIRAGRSRLPAAAGLAVGLALTVGLYLGLPTGLERADHWWRDQKLPADVLATLEAHAQWLDSDGDSGARARFDEDELAGLDLHDVRLSRADLSFTNLVRTDLSGAQLAGADLSGANLRDAKLIAAGLSGAELVDSDLSDSDLSYADLTAATLIAAILVRANLQGAILDSADLTTADLSSARLVAANLTAAELADSELSDSDLTNADLTIASLTAAILDGAILQGAILEETYLSGAELAFATGLDQTQLDQACGDDNTLLPAGLSIEPCIPHIEQDLVTSQAPQAAAPDADSAAAYVDRAKAFAESGDVDAAMEAFRQAVSVDPDYARGFREWGNFLYERMDYAAAIENYARAAELEPDHAPTYVNWGRTLSALGDLEGAAERYRRAIELQPDYADAYNALGVVLLNQENYAAAEDAFRQAVAIDETFAAAFDNWGLALFRQRNRQAAIEMFERAQQLEPERYADRQGLIDRLKTSVARAGQQQQQQQSVQQESDPALRQQQQQQQQLPAQDQGEPAQQQQQAIAVAPEQPPSSVAQTPIERGPQVAEAQRILTALGYGSLIADGVFGQQTERALRAYQEDRKLPGSGFLTEEVMQSLRSEDVEPGDQASSSDVIVNRPAAGVTRTIDSQGGRRYVINFDPTAAQVVIQGGDFALLFGDGGRIVFRGLLSLAQKGEAPVLRVGGVDIGGDVIVGQARSLGEPRALDLGVGLDPDLNARRELRKALEALDRNASGESSFPSPDSAD